MTTQNADMRSEYDFSQSIGGKHYRALQQGYTITVHQADGSKVVKEIQAPPGAVILDQDVHTYFPDSHAVNEVLHALIQLMPKSHKNI